MAVTAALTGTLTLTDGSTNITQMAKVLSGLSLAGTVGDVRQLSIGTGATAVTLPVASVHLLYIKNTHATQTLQVTWTPANGASAVILTLRPGSAILFVEASTGQGITALSLLGSGASTTCELVLAG